MIPVDEWGGGVASNWSVCHEGTCDSPGYEPRHAGSLSRMRRSGATLTTPMDRLPHVGRASCLIPAVILAALAGHAVNNGGFEHDLRDWKASWHVRTDAGAAVLTDKAAGHALLFQTQAVTAGTYELTFDYRAALSAEIPAGAFADAAFVSLYEADRPAGFIAEHDRFAAAHGVLDVDARGAYNHNGTVGPSPLGDAWRRFTGRVTVSHAHAVVAFEMYDLNSVRGDSRIDFDNVSLTPVTAP